MKIILGNEDIEKLVKLYYSGVNKVDFKDQDLTIELEVNPDTFMNKRKDPQPIVTPSKATPTEDDILETERKAGTMGHGGVRRNLQIIG